MPTLRQLKDTADDPRLQSAVGKTAIVGLYQFYKGEPVERRQVYGEIVGLEEGRLVLQTNGTTQRYPITYRALVAAQRGRYTLKTTGETVTNPDFLISWRLDLKDNFSASQWTANTAPHFASIVGEEWDFEYAVAEREYQSALVDSRGAELVGKTVIVGLRKCKVDENGDKQLVEQSRLHGRVARVSIDEGVVIKLGDGSEYALSPDPSLFQYAPPGEYEIQNSDEVITNPDLITLWTIITP